MSEIQKALAEATDTEPSKRKNETITSQDYMKRLAAAVADLHDDEWAKLPTAAQDWYNSAADAIEAKKDVPEFPDLPKAETSARRRGSAEPAAPTEPKVGDKVYAKTKRGREYTGNIVEMDDSQMVLDVDGKDIELERDKLDELKVLSSGTTVVAGDDELTGDPEVGDTVQVVTKRGRTIMGKVTELDADDMILEDATGEVHELSRSKLESVELKAKGKPAASSKKDDAAASSRRSGGDAAKDEKKDQPPAAKRVSAAANGGVSVTTRMRELICADLSATKDSIAAELKKAGLEFKQATLDLTYSDAHRLIQILRDLKKLK